MIVSQYYRELLSTSERSAYDIILDSVLNYKEKITLKDRNVDVSKIIDFIRYDQPQQFNFRKYFITITDKSIIIKPEYIYSKENYLKIRQLCIAESKKIISGASGSDYEKILKIHDKLCSKLHYVDEGDESHTIVGSLLRGSGVCEGFSLLFKLLCDMIDVQCLTVFGYLNNSTVPHLWNCVCLDNEWYHVDLTNDMPSEMNGFIKYDYLNLTDNEISRDHRFDVNPVVCSGIKYNYFLKNNLLFDDIKKLQDYIVNTSLKTIYFKVTPEMNNNDFENKIKSIIRKRKPRRSFSYSIMMNRNQNTFMIAFNR